jgi:hypothetical protein
MMSDKLQLVAMDLLVVAWKVARCYR